MNFLTAFQSTTARLFPPPASDQIPNYLTEEEPVYKWTVRQVIETGPNPQHRLTAHMGYQPQSLEQALEHPLTVRLDHIAATSDWDHEFMTTCHDFTIDLYDTLWPLAQGKKTARQGLRQLKAQKTSQTHHPNASAMHQPDRHQDAHLLSFWMYELMTFGDDASEADSEMYDQVNEYLNRMAASTGPEPLELLQIIHTVAQHNDPRVTEQCLNYSDHCWQQMEIHPLIPSNS